MVHHETLVAAIKVGGKILRENKDSVALPFGSEYSVLVKNLDSKRIQIKVSIDGQDVTDGTRLIIQPNSELELERFIRNGNLSAGNRFKFIERTALIEEHRGIGSSDGIVRVESWTEVVRPVVHEPIVTYYPEWRPWPYYYHPPIFHSYHSWRSDMSEIKCFNSSRSLGGGSGTSTSNTPLRSNSLSSSNFIGQCNLASDTFEIPNDTGITVQGSESNQQFHIASHFEVETQSRVITLHLKGKLGESVISKPVTVNHKKHCITCGKSNRGNNRFCYNCGTALEII